jgi:hypothetical protein
LSAKVCCWLRDFSSTERNIYLTFYLLLRVEITCGQVACTVMFHERNYYDCKLRFSFQCNLQK